MKIKAKSLFLIFFIFSGVISSFSILGLSKTLKVAQTTTKSFVPGIVYGTGDWDPSIYLTSAADYYSYNCLECLVWNDYDNNPHPVLATNWTVYERPGGGHEAIAFSLREGVTFHDGSEWNATVCKWNLDRNMAISANLTIDLSGLSGTGDDQNRGVFWIDASQFDSVFTADWNLSFYKYNIWGMGSDVPIINKTEVVGDYLINITMNTYRSQPTIFDSALFKMISMESYGDYTEAPIYGTGENPDFPQDNPAIFPGHMIGTGPYKFDYVDMAVTSTGHLIKNDDYWNKTLMEAEGLHSITDVYVRHFADDESRTTAALTGEIDYISDTWRIAIVDHDAVIADPLLNYIPTTLDSYMAQVGMKSEEGINTPCPDYGGLTPKQIWKMKAGFPMPAGINRTVRRAISYAFNYTRFVEVVGHGWGNISTGYLGLESIHYNDSIPAPYTNLTKAREILLSDPYYEGLALARGLTIGNDTADWNHIADTNPIGEHNMVYNYGHETPIFVERALRDIGFNFIGVPDTDFVTNILGKGLIVLYDLWPFQSNIPTSNPWAAYNGIFYSKNRMIPYAGYNFAIFANDTIDQLLAEIYTSDDPDPLYHELVDEFQNYHVPHLFCMQYQRGFAINTGWNFTASMPQRIGYREIPYYAWIGGERETAAAPPPIAGYDIYLISIASLFTLFGVIYAIMRKKDII